MSLQSAKATTARFNELRRLSPMSMKRHKHRSHDKSSDSKTFTVESMNYHCLKSSSFTDSSGTGAHLCKRFCDESSTTSDDTCSSTCSCKTSILSSRDSRTSDCTSFTRLKICAKKSKRRRNLLDNSILRGTMAIETSDFSSVSAPVPSMSDEFPSMEWSMEKNSDGTVETEDKADESGQEDKISSEFTANEVSPESTTQAMSVPLAYRLLSSSQCRTSVVNMVHVSTSSPAMLGLDAPPQEKKEDNKQEEGEGNAALEQEEKADESGNSPREEDAKETANHESEEATGVSSASVEVQISGTPDQIVRPSLASPLQLAPPASAANYVAPPIADAVTSADTDAGPEDAAVSPEDAAATAAQAHVMLKDLLALRAALRLSARQSTQRSDQVVSPSPSRTSTVTSASSRTLRFRPPFRQRSQALREKMEAQYTSYLVHLMEQQTLQGKPRGGMPHLRPVRMQLPQMEHRPLPPVAINLYCQAERMLVRGEYEAALILFSRGAGLHPDSTRFHTGILKARKAIERAVESASRLLLGDNIKSRRQRRRSDRVASSDGTPQTRVSSRYAMRNTVDPAKLAAEAAANGSLGLRAEYRNVVHLGKLGRDFARLRGGGDGTGAGGGDGGGTGAGEVAKKTKDDSAAARPQDWYSVPLEGTQELLVGTIEDIAKFVQRREEYWKRLPGPLHVPAVANLRDPKSAPVLHKQGGNTGSNAYNGPISPAAGGNGAKDAAHDRSEKRTRAQMAQMEEAVRERRFADVLTLGGQLLRALEARRPLATKQADRDAMIVTAQNYITIAHIERGELDSAARVSERMLRRARGLPDQRLLASALATAGRLRAAAGQLGWAAACWEQMVPLVQDDETRAWLFHELGRCSFQLHELQTARKYGEWSLSAARRAGSARWALNAALLSAQTEMQDGHYAAAHTFLEEARPFCAQLQDAAAAAYIRDAERLILTDRLPTVVVGSNKSKREATQTPAAAHAGKSRDPEMGGAGEGNMKALCLPERAHPGIPIASPAPATATAATNPAPSVRLSRRSSAAAAPMAAAAPAPAAPVASSQTHVRSVSGAP